MIALNQEYPTKDSAFLAIETQIKEFYETGYPEVWKNKRKKYRKCNKRNSGWLCP